MNIKTNHVRAEQSTPRDGSDALLHFAKLLTLFDDQGVLKEALKGHGNRFAAFLLGVDIQKLEPEELVDVFDESYVLAASDTQMALEELTALTGILKGLRIAQHLKEGEDYSAVIFDYSADDFREQVAEKYVIIPFLSECYVFDATVINSSLDG